MKGEGLKFVRVGLPFFTLVLGSAFALHYFQTVRYEFRRSKKELETIKHLKNDLTESGIKIKEGVTVDSIYNEIVNLDTENWENIRGPRDSESNAERSTKSISPTNLSKFVVMGIFNSTPQNADSSSSSSSSSSNSSTSSLTLRKTMRTHKMIFVANMGLKMGAGKLAAQVGHATLGVYRTAKKSKEGQAGLKNWERLGETKVVVKGQTAEHLGELYNQAKSLGVHAYLVHDAGFTQIPSGSRTVLGLFGPLELVDQVTGTLKLL
ncbi:Cytochrome c oxidase assembly protein COX16-like protein, mitochondrial [Aphelenchoides besseyi]|nr:Cytochrome c oxidase assembly protein COX16-like protein, mitochondrial [Aphelenchoides besseyi]